MSKASNKQMVKLSCGTPNVNNANTNSLHPTPKQARTAGNCTPSDNDKESSLVPSSSLSAEAAAAAKLNTESIKIEISRNRDSLFQVQMIQVQN